MRYYFSGPAPVDALLFLPARTRQFKRTEAAILISSEAGYMRFWSIYTKHRLQGETLSESKLRINYPSTKEILEMVGNLKEFYDPESGNNIFQNARNVSD